MPVLAYLINRFRDKPENIATAALFHTLQTSSSVRNGMLRFIAQLGISLGEISYSCQQRADEGVQPDLLGRNQNGETVLMVEAKFWASLTTNQPSEYLGRIAPSGLLLFISPEVRLQELWSELLMRLRAAGLGTEFQNDLGRIVKVNGRTLGLASWRRLLATLIEEAKQARDHMAHSDLQQLSALCDEMDTEAFIPLRAEEISDVAFARRSMQYTELVDAIADAANVRGVCRKLRSSAAASYYCVDLRFGELQTYLNYSLPCWSAWGISPIWFSAWLGNSGQNKSLGPQEKQQIKDAFSTADPTGGPLREEAPTLFIPVPLQPGVSKEEIVDLAVRQLARFADALVQSTGNALRFRYEGAATLKQRGEATGGK